MENLVVRKAEVDSVLLGSKLEDLNIEKATIDNELFAQLDGVIGIIMMVGTFVAICASIYLGIKYMLSSVEEKADIKKKMIPFIVGAAIFFGATVILRIIANIAKLF